MFKSLTTSLVFAGAFFGFSSQASATLILETYASGTATPETVGGYAMTDFAVTNAVGGSTTSVDSPITGALNFVDDDSNPLALNRRLANDVSWWNNGEMDGLEPRDYDIFTTDQHLITILLPENTFAFSFNVGANVGSTGNNAWLMATESNGLGIESQYRFNVNRDNTPGFGIYADNSDGSCSTLTSVTIEPDYWGVGNFSISQGSCTSVPEPTSLALLALGLLGFGVFRHTLNKKNKTKF